MPYGKPLLHRQIWSEAVRNWDTPFRFRYRCTAGRPRRGGIAVNVTASVLLTPNSWLVNSRVRPAAKRGPFCVRGLPGEKSALAAPEMVV
jgi:hypothetical protein